MAEKKKSEKVPSIDEEEAIRLFHEKQQIRIEMCRAEIESILEKYSCQLTAEVLLRQGQILPNIIVVPIPREG